MHSSKMRTVCFHTRVSRILSTGGGVHPQEDTSLGTHPLGRYPQADTHQADPLGQTPPGQTPPKQTPLG